MAYYICRESTPNLFVLCGLECGLTQLRLVQLCALINSPLSGLLHKLRSLAAVVLAVQLTFG